ncbi:MAG TPA: HIT domain-containing protein, partial [Micropepsaceae bacterium]|nr:HIT domain-containing protein [Micropepsaceae bacterium]
MAYDSNNIFAKILRGEIPCVKVFEDAKTLAFMDVMPQADGHTLVIPKEPAENLFDLSPEGAAAMMATTQKVAKAVK